MVEPSTSLAFLIKILGGVQTYSGGQAPYGLYLKGITAQVLSNILPPDGVIVA